MTEGAPCITVIAGTNGAGKSSIAGAALRQAGGQYFNPDELARRLRQLNPELSGGDANARAWREGVEYLKRAIANRTDYVFESTLGGTTITNLLESALNAGLEVRIWYVALESPEMHMARVKARVKKGGHDIPEADIRRRYVDSQRNLLRLMPRLTELQIYDNSADGDPRAGTAPRLLLVLHMKGATTVGPKDLSATPEWAKALVAAGIKLHSR